MKTATPSSTGSAWVTKNDRHLQLINTTVYEKESQQRAKAIEETRQQKLKQRDEREKRKFASRLQQAGHNPSASRSINGTIIDIEGIPFRVTKNGDRLMKVAGDPHPPSATPKTTMMWGVRFIRSKKGNLYRVGIIKAQRYEIPSFDHSRVQISWFRTNTLNPRRKTGIQKIDEPCKMFTTTGIPISINVHRLLFQGGGATWVLANIVLFRFMLQRTELSIHS